MCGASWSWAIVAVFPLLLPLPEVAAKLPSGAALCVATSGSSSLAAAAVHAPFGQPAV